VEKAEIVSGRGFSEGVGGGLAVQYLGQKGGA